MYGDPYYEIVASGSTGASADGGHLMLGNYTGLSLLNNEEVVEFDVEALGTKGIRFGVKASNDTGLRITGSTIFHTRPMRVGDASQLLFANDEPGQNGSMIWLMWRHAR